MSDLPLSPMLVIWTIGCGDATVEVHEDGTVHGDDAGLRERILRHLAEPVDVSHAGAGGKPLVLQPNDRRYVVARVRRLVEDAPDLEMLGVRVTDP